MSVDPRFPTYVELVDPATHLPYKASGGGTGATVQILDATAQPITGANPFPVGGTVTANAGSGIFNVRPLAPSASDYLPVRLTNGTAFYSATGGGGGAGTEYVEGDAVPVATGMVSLWKDAGNLVTAVSASTPLPVSVGNFPAVQPVSDNGGSLTVDGTVAVSNFPATQPVSGTVTANQGTSPWAVGDGGGSLTVDGPLTDAQLRATPVPISGTVTATGPLTDTQLRATAVPVSGPLTDTQLRATPVPVAAAQSGTWTVGLSAGSNTVGKVDQGTGGASAWKVDGSAVTQPVSGTFWQATQPVSGTVTANAGSGTFTVAGAKTNNNAAPGATNVGTLGAVATAAAPSFTEGNQVALSTDLAGSARVAVTNTPAVSQSGTWTVNAVVTGGSIATDKTGFTEGTTAFTPVGAVVNDTLAGDVAEDNRAALRMTPKRSLHVNLRDASATELGTASNPVRSDPTGTTAQPVTDNGGSLTVDGTVAVSGTVPVTGTVAATQSGTWNVGLSAGSNTVGKVDQGTGGASAWKVDGSAVTQPVSGTFWQATQPVSGTVTANAGSGTFTVAGGKTTNNAAPGATNVGVLGAVATAAAPSFTEGNQVALSTDLAGSLRVLVTNTPAVSQSGTWNVGLSAGSNTVGKVDQGAAGASAWKVDGSAVTQPVSGTVAATQSGGWSVTADTELPTAALLNDTFDTAATVVPSLGAIVCGLTQGATTASRVKAHDQQSDARANTINALAVNAYGYASNGTSGDRVRTAEAAANTAGTGLLGAGNLVYDTTNSKWQRAKGDVNGVTLVTGNLTHNSAVPGATNVGALTALANTALPTYTEGDQVLLSVDLTGRLRVETEADTIVRNGYNTLMVYDAGSRKMLQEILLQISDLSQKIFAE